MNTYKTFFLGIFLSILIATPFSAQAADNSMHDMGAMDNSTMNSNNMSHEGMSMNKEKNSSSVYMTKGKVISIDKEANKIEIAHEAVPSLNWSSMTMRFIVQDLSLLDDISSGDAVSFEFSPLGNDYVIVDIYPQ